MSFFCSKGSTDDYGCVQTFTDRALGAANKVYRRGIGLVGRGFDSRPGGVQKGSPLWWRKQERSDAHAITRLFFAYFLFPIFRGESRRVLPSGGVSRSAATHTPLLAFSLLTFFSRRKESKAVVKLDHGGAEVGDFLIVGNHYNRTFGPFLPEFAEEFQTSFAGM